MFLICDNFMFSMYIVKQDFWKKFLVYSIGMVGRGEYKTEMIILLTKFYDLK